MNCRTARQKLSDYAAGLLPPEEKRRARAHLLKCGACRRELSEIRKLDRLVESEQASSNELMTRRIMSRVRETEMARSLSRRLFVAAVIPLAALLAIAAIAVVSAPRAIGAAVEGLNAGWMGAMSPVTIALLSFGCLTLLAALVSFVTDRLAGILT
ncbi:MAG: zf-HC2 domain-containing protein [Armatimonadota bacterium]